MATRKGSTTESKEEAVTVLVEKCGECNKMMGKSDKGIMCELCESWFHNRCQDMSEETYRLLNQDKIHFYCGRCDRVVGKYFIRYLN